MECHLMEIASGVTSTAVPPILQDMNYTHHTPQWIINTMWSLIIGKHATFIDKRKLCVPSF